MFPLSSQIPSEVSAPYSTTPYKGSMSASLNTVSDAIEFMSASLNTVSFWTDDAIISKLPTQAGQNLINDFIQKIEQINLTTARYSDYQQLADDIGTEIHNASCIPQGGYSQQRGYSKGWCKLYLQNKLAKKLLRTLNGKGILDKYSKNRSTKGCWHQYKEPFFQVLLTQYSDTSHNYYKENQERMRKENQERMRPPSYTPVSASEMLRPPVPSGYELTSMKCELNPGKHPAEHIISSGWEKYSNSHELRTTTFHVNGDQTVCVPKGYLNKLIPITHARVRFTVMLTDERTLKDVVKGEPGRRHHFPDGAGKGRPIDAYFDGSDVYLPIDAVKKLTRNKERATQPYI